MANSARRRQEGRRIARLSYDEARAEQAAIYENVSAAGEALRSFPRNAIGLVSDAVKFSSEYRTAKTHYEAAFAMQRDFNAIFTKAFAAEIRAERARRGR